MAKSSGRGTNVGSGGVAADAVTTVAAWVVYNVQRGSTIALGSYRGYEMARPLGADYTLRNVRHLVVAGEAVAPEGILVFGKPKTDDWVSADIAPKNINEFQAFSAGTLIAQLRKYGIDYWVYSTGTTSSASTIIAALDGAAGFEKVADWTFERPRGGEPITTSVYRLDLDRLALDAERLYMAPDALERMVALIERDHATDLAGRLAPQVVPAPQTAATDVLMDRLRALGQP